MASKDSPAATAPILRLESLEAGYGKKQVLHSVSCEVARHGILAVIGHNGAGKSTLLKSIFGMIPRWSGRVIYDGQQVDYPRPRLLIKAGIVYVPQGNRVFADLTVRENLQIIGMTLSNRRERKARIEQALCAFPTLRDATKQRAGTLSGGEKQMLALAMAQVHTPRLLLLDEPSLGLAPQLARTVFKRIHQLRCERGTTVIIVEQKVREVLHIADCALVLRVGRVVFDGPASDLRDDVERLRSVFLP